MTESTLYEILDVSPAATPEEIRSAYRRLAPQVHPDQGGTAGLFRMVHQAYETLSAGADTDVPVCDPKSLPAAAPVVAARREHDKWVQALLAQEAAIRPRVCVTA